MKYLIAGIILFAILITYALLRAAGNADKRIEEMQKKEELEEKDSDIDK